MTPETPLAMTIGTALAVLLVIVALIFAIRKANDVALLLIAAAVAFVLPHLASMLAADLTQSFTFFILRGAFPLTAFALAGFAILQMLKRIKPPQLIVPNLPDDSFPNPGAEPFQPGPEPFQPSPEPFQPSPEPLQPGPVDAGPELPPPGQFSGPDTPEER